MKNVSRSRSSSKLSSCFRPDVDLDAAVHQPPPPSSLHRSSSFRMSCLPLPPKNHSSVNHQPPPKLTSYLLAKSLNLRALLPSRHGSRRRSSVDGRTMLNQQANAPNIPETKAELPPSCWGVGSESENISESCCSNKPTGRESRREDKSKYLGIFMVVSSLTLTVTVGKYWGALLTSTWLYLFSLVKARKGNAKAKLSARQVEFTKNRARKGWWGHKGSSASMKLP